MKPAEQTIMRVDLYDFVWTEPMRDIAARFGISDVGLRKICGKVGIPLPRAGYWMKVKHGKKVGRRPGLPASSNGAKDNIIIARSGIRTSDLDVELPGDILSMVTALRSEDGPLPVPQRVRTHALVANLSADDRARPKPIESRRRRFLNFLFAEVEQRGGKVAAGERHDFKITIVGEPLDVTVREPWKMKREKPTDEDRRKAWADGSSATSDPTGTLQLRIESWFDAPIRKQWRDGKDNPLENQVRSILIGFLVAASFDRKRRIEREEEHRREVVAEERLIAAEERRRKEKQQFDSLIREISAWEQAARIRQYVEARLATAEPLNDDGAEMHKWAKWAMALADGLDPTQVPRESENVAPTLTVHNEA